MAHCDSSAIFDRAICWLVCAGLRALVQRFSVQKEKEEVKMITFLFVALLRREHGEAGYKFELDFITALVFLGLICDALLIMAFLVEKGILTQ